MNRTFKVVITHNDRPLADANIRVTGKGRAVDFKTGSDGIVRVTGLAPGEYWLSAEFLGISAAYEECFHINESPSFRAKRKLRYAWGDGAPSTQQIAGRMTDSQPGKGGNLIWNLTHRVEVPIVGATLKLQDPTSGAVYVQTSDGDGQFMFGSVSSGTYVLHIEGGKAGDQEYDATDQLIAVDARANRANLQFMRREGGCGGTYLELRDSN